MKRNDDFEARRAHLAGMSDEQLRDYFRQLADKLTEPLLTLGYKNTSPAIERSVLLRMGFSSLEAKAVTDAAAERGLLCHGAGNLVYRLAKHKGMSIREAGVALSEGRLWDETVSLFEEVRA